MPKIEKEIINDLTFTCIKTLERQEIVVKGTSFFYNSLPYKLYIDFLSKKRILHISFFSLNPSSKSIKKNISINRVGLIKEVKLCFHKELSKIVLPLEYILFQQINLAYQSIELLFKKKFKHFSQYLFDTMYNIIYLECDKALKPSLKDKIFFAVTVRKTNRFRYFFDSEKLQILIDYFKANQILEFSPIELISALIIDEAGHTINILMNPEEDTFASLSPNDFVSFEEDFLFWSSESIMLGFEEISSYTVYKSNKVIFQISCKKAFAEDLKEIFINSKTLLKNQFRENLRKYVIISKELSKIPKPFVPNQKSQNIADFIGTIIGKGSAEFVKSILQP